MDKKRLGIFGGIILAVIGGLAWFTPQTRLSSEAASERLRVSVSTFSLYEAARAVAGGEIEVRSIVPLGSDAHMFSPNPAHVAELSGSALFVYNGAGFESWAESLKNTLPSTVRVVDMSQHVALQKSEEEHTDEHDHEEHAHDEHHQHGAYDPHYWLDIDNMIRMTRTLETEFAAIAPSKAEQFHKNAAAYVAELEQLKGEFGVGLAECKNRTLVSNHDAFGYLAQANALQTVSVVGLSTDEQPSAKNIADIVTLVKHDGIKTIFFETLASDSVARTIASETGAKAIALNPLANISEDELKSHQTYLSIMRENLNKLREAMECR